MDFITAIEPEKGIYIGGEFRAGPSIFSVENPATTEVIASVADADKAQAQEAVTAASRALPTWSSTPPRQRSVILRRAFDLMLAREADLAHLISAENGKSLTDATAEVRYAAEFFRWFSEEAVRIYGQYVPAPTTSARTIVTRRPVGVAALITPWNFPAAMATRKIAPALAAGCSVILRPASQTPLTAIALAHVLDEAGVPAGVVNIVPSSKASMISQTWLASPDVRAVSFTGSTRVGQELLSLAAKRVLVSSMELGGNAPFVVAADADIDLAVEGAMAAKLRGGGQACTAANRFYLHRSIADEFTEKFADRVRLLRVGPAQDPDNQIGPMISAAAVKDASELIAGAVSQGARIVAQAPTPQVGWFLPPTVLADVPVDASILKTEIFGPVAPLALWDDEQTLIHHLNDSEFGLAAYVFSSNLQWALSLAERIEAGMVGINRGVISDPAAPFGGVKQSGLGREGGTEGIHEFLETQYISVNW